MFQPGNLEALMEERRREFEREAKRNRLLARARGPRRGWRERAGLRLLAMGEWLSAWGSRLAAGASCPQVEAKAVPVQTGGRR